jgi:RNA polymerase sigma factor (TIGR02999 family)
VVEYLRVFYHVGFFGFSGAGWSQPADRTDNWAPWAAPCTRSSSGLATAFVKTMHDMTRVLNAIDQRDPHAAEQLLPLIYDALRELAAAKLAQEKPGQTLQATALVHEAYLRLCDGDRLQHWDSRGHFFAAAAEAMRRILIEQARGKKRQRHGGALRRVELFDQAVAIPADDEQLLLLDEALTKLAGIRPQAAKVVQLRFFGGLAVDDAAPLLGMSARTARRLWVFAQAWLRREMQAHPERQR